MFAVAGERCLDGTIDTDCIRGVRLAAAREFASPKT